MTLAADTRTGAFPIRITELARTLRHRLRPSSSPEPVNTGDALVRAMCHDMRSPLAALESALDRLDGGTGRPELLELARAQTRHLSSMLRTADATGGAPARRGTRRLVDVVRASVDASGLAVHQLTVRLGQDAADVEVGDARVQRVLTNLLENAHRHGAGRPVQVRADRRGSWVELAVTQSGVPADVVVSRLSQTAPPVDLDGLGLWSVRRQTRELGGRLFWSQAADGAFTLVVRLPDR